MADRSRRGGARFSWGDRRHYGFEEGEIVYVERDDRRRASVAADGVEHLVPHEVTSAEPSIFVGEEHEASSAARRWPAAGCWPPCRVIIALPPYFGRTNYTRR